MVVINKNLVTYLEKADEYYKLHLGIESTSDFKSQLQHLLFLIDL
jgi:hypothetical protein